VKPGLSSFLNLSRWLAAVLVLAEHARNLALVDLPSVSHPDLAIRVLYLLTGLGHQAVVVFFVISGYLVGGVTLERWRHDGPALRAYAAARVSRIYIVLLPALLIGLLLDWSGSHWLAGSRLYAGGQSALHIESLTDLRAGDLGPGAFLGNLLCLQGIVVPTYGSNGPLWSLAYEWWYYWLFALGAGALLMPRRRAALAVAAALVAAALPGRILLWGAIWLLGVALHAWTRSSRWKPHWTLAALGFGAAMAGSRLFHPQALGAQFGVDLGVGLGYALLLAAASRRQRPLALQAWHRRAADTSYSIYLAHFPALLFASALASQILGLPPRAQPTPAGLATCAGLVGVVLVWCVLVAALTERHTRSLRIALAGTARPGA
jgi:peptidoglycan/LPS O-acetylase OafA/YrhL